MEQPHDFFVRATVVVGSPKSLEIFDLSIDSKLVGENASLALEPWLQPQLQKADFRQLMTVLRKYNSKASGFVRSRKRPNSQTKASPTMSLPLSTGHR